MTLHKSNCFQAGFCCECICDLYRYWLFVWYPLCDIILSSQMYTVFLLILWNTWLGNRSKRSEIKAYLQLFSFELVFKLLLSVRADQGRGWALSCDCRFTETNHRSLGHHEPSPWRCKLDWRVRWNGGRNRRHEYIKWNRIWFGRIWRNACLGHICTATTVRYLQLSWYNPSSWSGYSPQYLLSEMRAVFNSIRNGAWQGSSAHFCSEQPKWSKVLVEARSRYLLPCQVFQPPAQWL